MAPRDVGVDVGVMDNRSMAVSEAQGLRRMARQGSMTYRLAFVFYVGGMISFFGGLGQGFQALWHLQLLPALVYIVFGFCGLVARGGDRPSTWGSRPQFSSHAWEPS